jgi:hypothetical protein
MMNGWLSLFGWVSSNEKYLGRCIRQCTFLQRRLIA